MTSTVEKCCSWGQVLQVVQDVQVHGLRDVLVCTVCTPALRSTISRWRSKTASYTYAEHLQFRFFEQGIA